MGERSFTTTERAQLSSMSRGRIDRAWTSVANEAILSGFRKARLPVIGSDADGESEDRLTEEDTALHLPHELVELLFGSDTEDEGFIGFADAKLGMFECGLLEYAETYSNKPQVVFFWLMLTDLCFQIVTRFF